MHSIINVNSVSFEIANGRVLFSDLNFTLEPKVTALVGPNGIGKTTLARLLTGELQPTDGTIRRTVPVAYFAQRQMPESITVDDYLATGYTWSLLGEQLLEPIDRETLCTNLSGGQWMRVRLARSIGDEFLILDEPTNDLDRDGRSALLQFLRNCPSGALLISHDRECLQLCDDVLELSNRGLAKYGGGWAAYESARDRERESLQDTLDLARRNRDAVHAERAEQLARQEKRNRRGAAEAARGGMPKILLGMRKRRAQSTSGKIDAATFERAQDAVRDAYEAFQELKIDPVMYADLSGRQIPEQKLVAEARSFNIRFRDWLYPVDLDFVWRGNVRIALKGRNGSGKSTLLRAVLGSEFETRGELRRGNLTTLYLDQKCASLDDSKSIFDNVREVSTLSESDIRNGLAKFLFAKDAVFQKVSTLSGGERLRAALARGLMSADKPELMVLDEPTNNLDLVNIEFLENLVREFRGALLVISHDEVFLENAGVTEKFVIGETD